MNFLGVFCFRPGSGEKHEALNGLLSTAKAHRDEFGKVSYCGAFALGLHQGKEEEGCPPRSHCHLRQTTCFGTASAGTEAGLTVSGGFAGCGCAVSSHSSGGPVPRSERAWTPRGSFLL